ncbi:MAG: fumarylacetoacetate hydrolase family protein [Nocardioidaceae bacterium]
MSFATAELVKRKFEERSTLKLLSFHAADGVRLGISTDAGVVDVRATAETSGLPAPGSMTEAIKGGDSALEQLAQIRAAADSALPEPETSHAPAVPAPGKLLCVGANYRRHAQEAGLPLPEQPIYFAKFGNSLAGHREEVVLPAATERGDYEVELVVVIGEPAHKVSREQALDHVFGYAVGNDLSARELQMRSSQWLYGKAIDGFAPLGPYVVTADDVPDPQKLDLKCWVNGELRQDSNTADMIFSVAELVSDLSQIMTLQPGDLIYTGTPEGVILGMQEPQWLQPGDEVTCEVEGLGRLVTTLVADKSD